MINSGLLDERIDSSGLKVNFIVDKLGISKQAFYKKKKGATPFRVSEIYVLCDLLKIADTDKTKIFYPEG
jgi:ACT domain-containing protein